MQVVGDDLLVTNPKRVSKAIEECTCNALLLKVCFFLKSPSNVHNFKEIIWHGCILYQFLHGWFFLNGIQSLRSCVSFLTKTFIYGFSMLSNHLFLQVYDVYLVEACTFKLSCPFGCRVGYGFASTIFSPEFNRADGIYICIWLVRWDFWPSQYWWKPQGKPPL